MRMKIFLWIFTNVSLDSFHESRLMKSNIHKTNFIKILWPFLIKILKITGSLSLFCTLMEYESGHIQYFFRISSYKSSWNMSVDSWKNTHKTFKELTHGPSIDLVYLRPQNYTANHLFNVFEDLCFAKAHVTRDILTHNITIKRYFWAIDFYWPR